MTRYPLLSVALAASFTAMASFAASAQDPALVGSGGGYPNRSAPSYGAIGGQTPMDYDNDAESRDTSIREVETLLQTVRGQLSGTADTSLDTAPNNDPYYNRGNNNAARYRTDAEALIRRHWKQLGPLTRDLYTSNYDRTDPNDPNQRYTPRYGNEGDSEARMLGGARDAEAAMQNLEDLLLPMLQDLKRGVDTELRQRSR